MSSLEKAIQIATLAHAGQVDKAGAPYILHPLRVMLRMTNSDARIAAVLHDVVEDSEWTLDKLRAEGFSDAVLSGIASVTHVDGETYDDFVLRAGRDPVGRQVKMGDLEDNSDLSRIANPTERDFVRLEKYRRSIALLSAQSEA